ncbi:MAG: acyl-CoA dehydrogenase [Gammaproteobacteria bacterium]|jgi:alkylation response protein AidB-like acyl-CoA dehydrogenase|nr:acyl-CoA dehydrogenase [Gammaproteobacteria bacterium]|tara:strand:- start:7099 stop:8313 length:1215 start_codon:yes stop_codon:yes gene_type:complete
MSSIEFEVELSEIEQSVQETVHRFAEEVMRPVGQELDKMPDPQQTIDADSVVWRAMEQYAELGINTLSAEDNDLSPVENARLNAIIHEEMGWGDAGLAMTMTTPGGGMVTWLANISGREELMNRYDGSNLEERGCWAITEPDHGSDTLALNQPHFSDPEIKANCIAVKDGDEYVIRGQKSSWVSGAPIATVMGLYCTIDGNRGFEGGGVAIVPLDLPGVSKGKPLNKLGQRSMPQGEVFFDEVRIPADYMIVDQDAYKMALQGTLTMANSWMATTFAGVARSAFDLANAYSKERVQGGKPICEHQSVKLRLFDMFRKVETASTFARKVSTINNGTDRGQLHHAIAAKTYSTRVAFEVASEALQIFGGNGLTKEYPIEKILRDARASMIEDGCNEVLSIVGAEDL